MTGDVGMEWDSHIWSWMTSDVGMEWVSYIWSQMTGDVGMEWGSQIWSWMASDVGMEWGFQIWSRMNEWNDQWWKNGVRFPDLIPNDQPPKQSKSKFMLLSIYFCFCKNKYWACFFWTSPGAHFFCLCICSKKSDASTFFVFLSADQGLIFSVQRAHF